MTRSKLLSIIYILFFFIAIALVSCEEDKSCKEILDRPSYGHGQFLENGEFRAGEPLCSKAWLDTNNITISFSFFSPSPHCMRLNGLGFGNIPVVLQDTVHLAISSSRDSSQIPFAWYNHVDYDILLVDYFPDTNFQNFLIIEHYDSLTGDISGQFELNMEETYRDPYVSPDRFPDRMIIEEGQFEGRVNFWGDR